MSSLPRKIFHLISVVGINLDISKVLYYSFETIMSIFRKQSDKLTDYFIGDLLGNTNNLLERSKIEMLCWFCFLSIFQLLVFLPFVIKDSSLVATFFIAFSILILVSSLFAMKILKIYKPILIYFAIASPFLTLSLIIISIPQDLSVFMTIIYITLSLVIFTLNDKWAYTIVIATIFTIGITGYLKSIGIQSGDLLGVTMVDPTIIDMYSIFKIGIPMILLALAIANFVRINRKTNDQLIRNINKKEALNLSLQASQDQFKTLVEGAADLVYELTPEGNFKYTNPAFEQVTGYSPDFIKGKNYTFLIHPNAVNVAKKYLEQGEYAISNKSYLEFPILTKVGKTVWLGQNINYINDENGNLGKYMCISRDITQQKEISTNLEKAKAEAEKAAMIKAQFLSAMSHEIRTPINAVLGTIHLMADENPRMDQIAHLNTLKYSAENLMNLVSHILDYNKLDSNKITLKNAPFTLKECLRHTNAGIEQFAKDKGINFSIEIDPKLPKKLIGDSFRISQVLSNLAHNAVKFTQEGNVKIKIKEQQSTDESVRVLFSVSDTGRGIPNNKLGTIFKKFNKASNDTVLEGTGLGLAISSKIAVLLNTRIEVESIVGKGSTFSFLAELKRADNPISTKIPTQKGLQIKTQNRLENSLLGMKILLVEDNLINQKVASKIMSRWGANITIAKNGQVAVDKIQQMDFDIVLMDIQMPVMDGIEATSTIRAMGGKYAKIPIVALTASAVLEVRQNALEAGLNDFLTKPFQPEILNKTILKHTGFGKSAAKSLDKIEKIKDLPKPT